MAPVFWAAGLGLVLVAAAPAMADEAPKYGGILTFMIPADAPPSFDAHREGTFATVHSAASRSGGGRSARWLNRSTINPDPRNVRSGDFRRGADWWAGHRSLAHTGTCNGPAAAMSQQFTLGCEAAKARLTSKDVKRKSDPDYKRGWNSFTGSSSPPVPEAHVPTAEQGAPAESEAMDADSVKRLNEQELRRITGH